VYDIPAVKPIAPALSLHFLLEILAEQISRGVKFSSRNVIGFGLVLEGFLRSPMLWRNYVMDLAIQSSDHENQCCVLFPAQETLGEYEYTARRSNRHEAPRPLHIPNIPPLRMLTRVYSSGGYHIRESQFFYYKDRVCNGTVRDALDVFIKVQSLFSAWLRRVSIWLPDIKEDR